MALIVVMALGHGLGPVLTFGSSVGEYEWPAYEQVRSILLGRFVQNLDWVAVILWTHGFLIEVAVFVYAAALTLAKLFGLRSQRPLVPVLGALAVAASLLVGETQRVLLLERWFLDAYGFVVLGWVVPLSLLGISYLKGRGRGLGRRPPLGRDASPIAGLPAGKAEAMPEVDPGSLR